MQHIIHNHSILSLSNATHIHNDDTCNTTHIHNDDTCNTTTLKITGGTDITQDTEVTC